MARIRTIKPEFPQSESMGRISREGRLCFILLWTLADDEGRLRGNSRMLASLLFPYDEDAGKLMESWLSELDKENCLRRFKHDGDSYVQICNWLKHQKIDKPSKSKIPIFEESSRILSNPLEQSSEDQGSRIKDQGKDLGLTPLLPTAPDEIKIKPEEFSNVWNEFCGSLPRVERFTESRKRKVETRIHQGITLEYFQRAVFCCVDKPFLRGENKDGWTATFDWLIENDKNIEKAINNYNSTGGKTNGNFETTVDSTKVALAGLRANANGAGKDSFEVVGNPMFPNSESQSGISHSYVGTTIEGEF